MYNTALSTIEKYNMILKGDHIILGVSGGADSSALLHFLYSIKKIYNLTLTVVHINHGLRGDDADNDAHYVEELCKSMGVRYLCFNYDIKDKSKQMGVSEEEAGRIIRYSEFQNAVDKYDGSKIAVAHNMNDQAETLLMRLARGAGIKGLSGIAPVRGNIIRPLIECSRNIIEAYCAENDIDFRTDYTNLKDIYTRNKIRLKLIPWMEKELNENTILNISRTAGLLAEEDSYMEEQASIALENCILKSDNNYVYIEKNILKSNPLVIQRRIIRRAFRKIKKDIKDLSYNHINSVLELIEKPTGSKVDLALGLKAEIQYEKLVLYLGNINDIKEYCYNIGLDETIFIKEINKYVKISLNEEKKQIKPTIICTKAFDYDKIKFNIQIRTRKPNDRIFLKGLNGTKKIKDFFIDEKIPRQERSVMPLVACGTDIIWILEKRVSDYFVANESTSNILFIQIWEDV